MNKLFTLITAVFLTATIWAQSPAQMSYQAVIRDAQNTLLTSQSVGVQISVLQGSISGNAVYTETHTTSTNSNGLLSLAIGTGATSDDFEAIDWANGSYLIKTETDPTGGTNYTISGTQQLLSVPYSLHAETAENGITTTQSETITTNEVAIADLLTELEALENRVAVLEGGSTPYNPGVSVQDNLDNGVPILDLLKHVTVEELYGKTYEGGLIFYVNEYDGTGLVAAPTDQAFSARLFGWGDGVGAPWGCYTRTIDGAADGRAIGTGALNTLNILAGCSEPGIAAQLCADLVLNEKEDWFLPSIDALHTMFVNLHQNSFGGFAGYGYWSSTEYYHPNVPDSYSIAETVLFNSTTSQPILHGLNKSVQTSVRAVRAF